MHAVTFAYFTAKKNLLFCLPVVERKVVKVVRATAKGCQHIFNFFWRETCLPIRQTQNLNREKDSFLKDELPILEEILQLSLFGQHEIIIIFFFVK